MVSIPILTLFNSMIGGPADRGELKKCPVRPGPPVRSSSDRQRGRGAPLTIGRLGAGHSAFEPRALLVPERG